MVCLGILLAAWTSYNVDASSTDGVYAQEYTTNGAAVGSVFRVNTTTAGNQNNPSVGSDAAAHRA